MMAKSEKPKSNYVVESMVLRRYGMEAYRIFRFMSKAGRFLESDKVHIGYMEGRPHDEPEVVENFHHELLSGILGSKEAALGSMLYHYRHAFS